MGVGFKGEECILTRSQMPSQYPSLPSAIVDVLWTSPSQGDGGSLTGSVFVQPVRFSIILDDANGRATNKPQNMDQLTALVAV